jgi:hypothetical protein
MPTIKEEYEELIELKGMVESPIFQKFISKPLKDYRFEQKNNFFSDSVKDQWRKGGRVETVNLFFRWLKQYDKDLDNKRFDLDGR